MRAIRSFLLSFALLAGVAQAATFLQFNSQPGDAIGQGQSRLIGPGDAIFTGRIDSGGGVEISLDPLPGTVVTNWQLSFEQASGPALVPGVYEGAERYPFNSAGHPGLSLSGEGRGCNLLYGRFTVHEVEYGPADTVTKLAADFEQHCEGADSGLYGGIRFNSSIPYIPQTPAPFTPASFRYVSQPGDFVGQGQSRLLGRADAFFSARINFMGGVDVSLASISSSFEPHWNMTFVPAQGQVFGPGVYEDTERLYSAGHPGLDVTGNGGGCNRSFGRFTVYELEYGPAETLSKFAADFEQHCEGIEPALYGGVRINSDVPYTLNPPVLPEPAFIRIASMPGDPVGQGGQFTLTRANGFFSTVSPSGGAEIAFNALPFGADMLWMFRFAAAPGAALGVGTYDDARFPGTAGYPGMDVSHGTGCDGGKFTIFELEYGPIGTLKKLALDFEQYCHGSPYGLFGGIRYNSALAYAPPVIPSAPTQLENAEPTVASIALHPGASAHVPRVRVLDQYSNPYAGATVRFSTSPCGSLQGAQSADVLTGADGIAASPDFVAGAQSDFCDVYAQLVLAPVFVRALRTEYWIYVPADIDVALLGSPSITVEAGQSFRAAFRVTVMRNRRSAVPVTFTVTNSSGAMVSSLTSTTMTDGLGDAYADGVAGGTEGTYTIVASVEGVTASIAVTQHAPVVWYDPPPLPPTSNPISQRASGASPSGLGMINAALFTTQSSCALVQPQFFPADSGPAAANPPPAHFVFPFGLASFRADNCGAGQAVDFVIDYPKALPPNAVFWRFGPTPDNHSAHWYPMSGVTLDNTQVRFRLVDGELGDDDLAANGSIGLVGGVMSAGGIYQDMWWAGPAENGWGMSVVQHGDTLFSVIYAYDAAGNPTWYVMPGGTWNNDQTVYTGSLYAPHGSPFFNYDASRLQVGSAIGAASLTFTGSDSARLETTINGVRSTKVIHRQGFGVPVGTNQGTLGDMWWGGSLENGWGVSILHQYSTMFMVWFTYDASGAATWFVMPGGAWTSADAYEGRVFRTTGSPWVGGTYDASKLKVVDVGSYRVRFSGETATLEYTIDGHSGSLPLSRQPF